MYMNRFVEVLGKMHVSCRINTVCVNYISYADTVVFLSVSACDLRNLLLVYVEYAIQHGL